MNTAVSEHVTTKVNLWLDHTCVSRGRTCWKGGQRFCIQVELNKWNQKELKTNKTQSPRYVTPTFSLAVNYDAQNLQ